jgi:stress-induced morphogen
MRALRPSESRIAFPKQPTVSCVKVVLTESIVEALQQSRKGEGPLITQDTLTDYIRRAMPDALVTMIDKTGTMDHLKVTIVSDTFQGKNLLDRHRLIYQALDVPLKDGRIHALELTAKTKTEHQQLMAESR